MFQEIENNRKALLTYIESAYHFSDENLLQQRSELLHQEGIITQRPYIESGAKYRLGKMFAELDIDKKIADVLTSLAKSKLLFNPPYLHQVEAIEKILSSRKNIIVTTGTGSGKTECFLLPILGRLIEEAPKPSFKQRAVRTLLLYPMNALVNDQLGRLRVLFGSKTCFDFFKKTTGRPIKFGRYTGRTLFPGLLPNPNDSNFSSKMQQKLAGLSFYYKIADRALKNQDEKEQKKASDVIQQLYKKGKFPVKHSATGNPAQGFCDWFGQSGGRWLQNGKLARTIERADDSELLVRHEMQNTPPDILVTNYSMLEYMLLRPIERNIFSITKSFYQENPDERFILVLDESHLYNG
ncbi:MAG: DEAD/DEAH box helicase, partial [Planctomycetaceae bacterium]|nr:DEAD/DEAH box helicase [Planctomycetaceae bacterium]